MFGAFQVLLRVDALIRHVLRSPVHDHSLLSVHIFHWHWYGPAIGHIPIHRAPSPATEPGKSAHAGNTVLWLPS